MILIAQFFAVGWITGSMLNECTEQFYKAVHCKATRQLKTEALIG